MPTGLAISRFQRFAISDTRPPRALPRAFAFRAFGAEDPAFHTRSTASGSSTFRFQATDFFGKARSLHEFRALKGEELILLGYITEPRR